MGTSFPQQKTLSLSTINNNYEGLMFACHTGELTVATTAETPIFLVTNPTNSGVCVANFYRKLSALTKNKTVYFRYYIRPTITSNGTECDINNLRIDGNVPTSKIKAYFSPTVSDKGTHLTTSFVSAGSIYTEIPILFDPGTSFLVTAQVESNNDKVGFDFIHYEINP